MNIAWQASKPAQFVSGEPQQQTDNDQYGTYAYKHFAYMFHTTPLRSSEGYFQLCYHLNKRLSPLMQPCTEHGPIPYLMLSCSAGHDVSR